MLLSKKTSAWVIEHRYYVLGVLLVATLFFALQMRKLVIKSELDDLIPTKHPFIETHEKYKDQLGNPFKVFLMLRVTEGNIYNKTTLEKVIRITDALDAIPGVNHNDIYSIASRKLKKVKATERGVFMENFMDTVPSSMKEFEEIVHRSAGILGGWVSRDEKSVLFRAGFIENLTDYDVIFKEVRRIINEESDTNHIIYAAGEPILTGWVNQYKGEMGWIFMVTFLSLFAILYSYFRNLPGILVPVASTIMGAIWGLGFWGLIGYSLEPLIMVIPLLITARALSHAIQITERYFECYEESKDVKNACTECMTAILPPGILGIVTDALGIFFIAVAPIPIVQKLAYMCGFWAISIIFSSLILTPLLLSFFPPPKNTAGIVDMERGGVQKILGLIAKVSYGRNAIVTAILVTATAIFTGILASKVDIGDVNPGTPLLWEDSDFNVAVGQINSNFSGTEELFVLVEGERERAVENPRFLSVLKYFQDYMEKQPLVSSTFSVADLLPPIQRSIFGGHPKWETLPLNATESSQLFYRLLGHSAPGDFDIYFTRDESVANVIVWYKDHTAETLTRATESVRDFIEKNKDLLSKEKCNFRLASGNIGILAAINESVKQSQLLNFTLVMTTVFLLCSLSYRSVAAALILMIPLNMANIITLSIMYWLGIPLNINTLPIVSVGVGVGIDYGIYLLSRLREESRDKGEYSLLVATTAIKTTGKAIFFTATTMVCGVIFWYFLSSLKFQAEMGLLLATIMFVNMIGALVVIPTLVYIFKPKFLRR